MSISNEFGGTLFSTSAAMCRAIASEWLSAGGLNGRRDVEVALASFNDETLAGEVISTWGLDKIERAAEPEYGRAAETWMETRGIERRDIVVAFAEVRADPAQAFRWDDAE